MTLTEVLTMALRRAGLSTSTTGSFWTIARDYFNLGMQDLASRAEWRFLRASSANLTLTAGQAANELASDVLYPMSFYDRTNNKKILPMDESRFHDFDPDKDSSGPVNYWTNTGIGSAGYVEVSWTPIPDATDIVYYTYRSIPADKTSSNDSTNLLATMPLWGQHAMVFYISGTYKGEKGDMRGEAQDIREYEKKVSEAIAINSRQEGQTRHRMSKRRRRSPSHSSHSLSFTVDPGTL
jgi:hypothetical protein